MAGQAPAIGARPEIVEHSIELSTNTSNSRDAVKGLLHTIFFHRLFPTLRPLSREVVFPPSPSPVPTGAGTARPPSPPHDITVTLPLIDDPDLETLITAGANKLTRLVQPSSSIATDKRADVLVHFFEKKRKKAATGFAGLWGAGTSTEGGDVCWETWRVQVRCSSAEDDTSGSRCAKSLRAAAFEVAKIAGEEKAHIPPITSAETNPFPYEVVVSAAR